MGEIRREVHRERRKSTLTPEDLVMIREVVAEVHTCRYDIDPKDMDLARDLIGIYKETRNVLIKAIIGLFVAGVVILFVLGVNHGMINGKGG